jgi:multidrug efflux pump subunit AcrB
MSVPSGSMDEGRQKTTVRSLGDFTRLDDIENVVIAQIPIIDQAPQGMNTGGSIYVRDLATVSEDYEDVPIPALQWRRRGEHYRHQNQRRQHG